jgi:hypothetical protein
MERALPVDEKYLLYIDERARSCGAIFLTGIGDNG